MSSVCSGNAKGDGSGGWFLGDRQPPGSRYHENVFIKYGRHKRDDVCAQPHKEMPTMNVSILVEGGPLIHFFKQINGVDLPDVEMKEIGDFVIYGPDVTHTWKATGDSVVVTMQFPPSGSEK